MLEFALDGTTRARLGFPRFKQSRPSKAATERRRRVDGEEEESMVQKNVSGVWVLISSPRRSNNERSMSSQREQIPARLRRLDVAQTMHANSMDAPSLRPTCIERYFDNRLGDRHPSFLGDPPGTRHRQRSTKASARRGASDRVCHRLDSQLSKKVSLSVQTVCVRTSTDSGRVESGVSASRSYGSDATPSWV